MALQRTAALVALAVAACTAPPAPPQPAPAAVQADTGGVRVRLSFGRDADLDLHVTDPLQETVYFANTPSASGGTLAADVRCESPGPRSEEITWEAPPAGRYRVGVDFPIRCRMIDRPAPYVLEVWANGVRHELRNAIAFGRFEPIVYEFDVRAAGSAPAPATDGP
jgi:hypothetical protein